jgi:hypothetical protein
VQQGNMELQEVQNSKVLSDIGICKDKQLNLVER